jgi:hypothetical protein
MWFYACDHGMCAVLTPGSNEGCVNHPTLFFSTNQDILSTKKSHAIELPVLHSVSNVMSTTSYYLGRLLTDFLHLLVDFDYGTENSPCILVSQ